MALACKPVAAGAPRLNGERNLHCEVYKARNDVQSVIHAHDLAVIPFGVAGVPLRPVIAQASFLPPETPLFEIRDANSSVSRRGTLVLDGHLGAALAERLGADPVVLMRGPRRDGGGAFGAQSNVRAIYTHIDAQAQSAALALGPNITAMNAAELATNAAENFDADRPWQNYKQRLPAGR